MLFLGCERDNVQLTNDECYKHEALELFLKDYIPREDSFRDRIVNGVIAKNESNGMIYDLANRYGQPLWGIERTATEKSINTLLVPITHPNSDSITAVMMFTQPANSDSITYRILDNNHRDTLVTDFLLYCQTVIYGRGFNPNRTIKPIADTKDSKLTITGCWDVYTGSLTTLTYSYTFCTYRVVELPTLNDDDNGGSSGTLPGSGGTGSDGGGSSGGNSGGPNTSSLDATAKNNLINARISLESGPCLSKTIMNSTWNSNLTIGVNSSLGSMGSHSPGVIEFRSATSISDITLLHELFHEYQNKVNGILPVTQLSEFEAWLFVDLYLWDINDESLTWTRGLNPYSGTVLDYKDWIDDIYENGFTDSNMANYTKWFNKFMEVKDSAYGDYPVGNNSNPGAIINVLNVCNY